MVGTIINIITVIIGSFLGLMLRNRLPEQYKTIILQGIGIVTIVIGLQMALQTENILIAMGSLLIGGLSGQLLRIDTKLMRIADRLKNRFAFGNDKYFSEGFITASIIFCVGPMTILGSINDGIRGDYNLLAIKSVLDGFTAIAHSASLGIGVLFSIITILLIQGGLTVSASFAGHIFDDLMIAEMSAVGGMIIMGIGLVILEIKQIKVANFLPALLYSPLLILLQTMF